MFYFSIYFDSRREMEVLQKTCVNAVGHLTMEQT